MSFDVNKIRSDFPILTREINGKPLIYLDNAATTQKPIQVIDRISNYYRFENSNVHRGNYYLSNEATMLYENARHFMAKFINARSHHEIIFTRGTTESINMVAASFAEIISQGDEILITQLEHHSNLVPWQQLCLNKKASLIVIPIADDGSINIEDVGRCISPKTRLIAMAHISNVLGTINNVNQIVDLAHKNDIPVLLDGAQAIAHIKVDVQEIDCDFYAFSSHKAYGPMGTGVLYGKEEWLNKLTPYQFGGEMIDQVSFKRSTFNELPYKFEAGTPNVADVLGMETAIKYIQNIGIERIKLYEDQLLDYASKLINKIDGIDIIGNAPLKTSVLSLNIPGIHPYDIGTLLDQTGIAVRTGNHCAQPLIDYLKVPGTLRASFAMYNTFSEIDTFVSTLEKVIVMLR